MLQSDSTFTVGIPTYNRTEYIEDALESLLDQKYSPDEIIIVDDGDGDMLEKLVQRYQERCERRGVDLVYKKRNKSEGGLPGARNEIISESTGDIICFVDDDVVCRPTWLKSIAQTFDQSSDIAAVGGPAISVTPDLEPHFRIVQDNRHRNQVSKYGEIVDNSHRWVPQDVVEVGTLLGANMSFRTEVLKDVGGFDEKYRGTSAFEENDIFVRISRDSDRIMYHPEAFVYHYQATAGGIRQSADSRKRSYYWFARNLVRFRWKHFRNCFFRGMSWLFVNPTNYAPIWKHPLIALSSRDPSHLWYMLGYAGGIRHETGSRFEIGHRSFPRS